MLRDFKGAGRRFEVIGEAGGVIVIDDYAHHPTEVAATLPPPGCAIQRGASGPCSSRTPTAARRPCLHDYAHSFDDADFVIFLDIYPAREKIDLGMHSRQLLEVVKHERAQYIGGIEDAAAYLLAHVEPRRHRDHHERGRRQSGGTVGAGRVLQREGNASEQVSE